MMSKTFVPERGERTRATTPTSQPKLARGTRDIPPATVKAARGTREIAPLLPDSDEDTIVVDADPSLAEDLSADSGDNDVADVGEVSEVSEVTESQAGEHAAAIDA